MLPKFLLKRLLKVGAATSTAQTLTGPGWLGVKPTDQIASTINSWCREQCGFDEAEESDTLHTTLAYVGNPIEFKATLSDREYNVDITGVECFGPDKDTLVLTLKSSDLEQRFNELVKGGYQPNYPDFKPHMTIKKECTPQEYQIAQAKVAQLAENLGQFNLHTETWTDIKDD